MWWLPWVYVSFCGVSWLILGRMREARDEVCEAAEVVHSVRMVVLWAMHELWFGMLLVSHHTKPSPGRGRGMEGCLLEEWRRRS